MTELEARTVAAVIAEAAQCNPTCVTDLAVRIRRAFPSLAWPREWFDLQDDYSALEWDELLEPQEPA